MVLHGHSHYSAAHALPDSLFTSKTSKQTKSPAPKGLKSQTSNHNTAGHNDFGLYINPEHVHLLFDFRRRGKRISENQHKKNEHVSC